MRKTKNEVHIIGLLYEYDLEIAEVQNPESENYGKSYIRGSIDIATDDDCLNIVTVHYTYVAPEYKSGKKNFTYAALEKIINEGKTILVDGKENATIVKADPTLALREFYTSQNGEDTLVSVKRNEGGFLSILQSYKDKTGKDIRGARFVCDVLINGVKYIEANEEKNIQDDYLVIRGAAFNFKEQILPFEFVLRNKEGFAHFENLDASPKNLAFTQIWGNIVSTTVIHREVIEGAFGDDDEVREVERNVKEWEITNTYKPERMYDIGDEKAGITTEEIQKAMSDREVYLADLKKQNEEYQKSLTQTNNGGVTAMVDNGFMNLPFT